MATGLIPGNGKSLFCPKIDNTPNAFKICLTIWPLCFLFLFSFFKKDGPFPASFLYFRLFYKQLTVIKCSIKVANDWIRTRVLSYRKRPLCQLRHNHFPHTGIVTFWFGTALYSTYSEQYRSKKSYKRVQTILCNFVKKQNMFFDLFDFCCFIFSVPRVIQLLPSSKTWIKL